MCRKIGLILSIAGLASLAGCFPFPHRIVPLPEPAPVIIVPAP